jgi:mRNA interferase MazF
MRRHSVTCDPWDVATVPFPFTEREGTKRRPALVLSRHPFNQSGHTLLAMITSAHHAHRPGATVLYDLAPAGLPAPCLVRLKLFTLDNRLILRRLGQLSQADLRAVDREMRTTLL